MDTHAKQIEIVMTHYNIKLWVEFTIKQYEWAYRYHFFHDASDLSWGTAHDVRKEIDRGQWRS